MIAEYNVPYIFQTLLETKLGKTPQFRPLSIISKNMCRSDPNLRQLL